MKRFMDEDFLLYSDAARKLYEIASEEPVLDFHCHLDPKEIYENKTPRDIAQLWLEGDHYKWRAMRANGIEEEYITGNVGGYEKFKAWAGTLPYCIGNPLYHWSHLELLRFFDIDTPLTPKTADDIWKRANKKIGEGGFRPREIISKFNVKAVFTTDDPADDLIYHKKLAAEKDFGVKILPTFRPDRLLSIEREGFSDYVGKLAETELIQIRCLDDLKAVISRRVGRFAEAGCAASDHSFSHIPFCGASRDELESIFKKAMSRDPVTEIEADKYKTALFRFLCGEYVKHDMAAQIHIGALRNNSTKMFLSLGPDTGYDSINDRVIAEPLSRMLDSLESDGILPKTILYVLNPKDNYTALSVGGSFQTGGQGGGIQFGAAWWMNDHIDGITRHLTDLANLGVLGKFIGMVTDSRSFLSYSRHEYFRRILCNFIGNLVQTGQYPFDMDILSEIARGICYKNAAEYFNI